MRTGAPGFHSPGRARRPEAWAQSTQTQRKEARQGGPRGPPDLPRRPLGRRLASAAARGPPGHPLLSSWRRIRRGACPPTRCSLPPKKKKKTLRLGGWIAQERLPSSFTCALASPPSEAAQPEGGALFPAELSRGGGFREEGLLPPPRAPRAPSWSSPALQGHARRRLGVAPNHVRRLVAPRHRPSYRRLGQQQQGGGWEMGWTGGGGGWVAVVGGASGG